MAGRLHHARQPGELGDDERGVRLPARVERLFHPEVQLPPVRQGEPRPAPSGERGGLLQFLQAEQAGVEATSFIFPPGGHRHLDVIQGLYHRNSSAIPRTARRLSWNPKGETLPEYDPLADLYDLEYVHDQDVSFWLALAGREPGPVVEWGAGTGRIAGPLATAGHDVTAVELSEVMVERGRRKTGNVRWIVGDMRTAGLAERYGLAICAFNSFLCLPSVDDALLFLSNAREHLKPGGLLGIEVSAFSPEELAEEPGGPVLRHDLTRDLPDGGSLDRFSLSRYDAATQLMEMRLFYELYDPAGEIETHRAHDLAIRLLGRAELELMLRLTGFETEAVYGGFDREPFAAGSDHLIVLARK